MQTAASTEPKQEPAEAPAQNNDTTLNQSSGVVRMRPDEALLQHMIILHSELSQFANEARRTPNKLGFRGEKAQSLECGDLVLACQRTSIICETIFMQHQLADPNWIALRQLANTVQTQVDVFMGLVYQRTDGIKIGESAREVLCEVALSLKQFLIEPILQLEAAFAQAAQAPKKGIGKK